MKYELKTQYKGISTNDKKWIYGSPVINPVDGDVYMLTINKVFNFDNTFTSVINMNKILHETLCVYLGVNDKNGKEIFSNDIICFGGKNVRVYLTIGGLVFKAPNWASNIEDLTPSDSLIVESLSDMQNHSFIKDNAEYVSNFYDDLTK